MRTDASQNHLRCDFFIEDQTGVKYLSDDIQSYRKWHSQVSPNSFTANQYAIVNTSNILQVDLPRQKHAMAARFDAQQQ